MKIAFVHLEDENIGIEYLSALLKREGHEVRLFLEPRLFKDAIVRIKLLERLFSFENGVIEDVKEFNPDIVCFSSFTDQFQELCILAKKIKDSVAVPVVFGGIHPTIVPEEVIKKEFIDFLVVGEGEAALLELVGKLEKKEDASDILNVWAKKGKRVIKNTIRPPIENLDDLPFPDKELFYEKVPGFRKIYRICGSRGCPFSCTYCGNEFMQRLYSGKYYRKRSVNSIIEELKIAKKKYHPRWVWFYDETFVVDLGWFREFAGKYKKEIGLPYSCFMHPSMVNDEVAELLNSSGCAHIELGVGSTREKTRAEILNRHHSNAQLKKAVNILNKTKAFLIVSNIIGLPKQSKEEALELAKFYSENKVDLVHAFWLRYFPKLKIIDIALRNNILKSSDVKKSYENPENRPLYIEGDTYDTEMAKIRNLILISPRISKRSMNWIINKKIYRYFPHNSTLNPALINMAVASISSKIFRAGKRCPPTTKSARYIEYIKKRLLGKKS